MQRFEYTGKRGRFTPGYKIPFELDTFWVLRRSYVDCTSSGLSSWYLVTVGLWAPRVDHAWQYHDCFGVYSQCHVHLRIVMWPRRPPSTVGVGTSAWWYPHCLRAELATKGICCARQSTRLIHGPAAPCRLFEPRINLVDSNPSSAGNPACSSP